MFKTLFSMIGEFRKQNPGLFALIIGLIVLGVLLFALAVYVLVINILVVASGGGDGWNWVWIVLSALYILSALFSSGRAR